MTKLQQKINHARFFRMRKRERNKIVWVGNKRYGTPRFLVPYVKVVKAMRLKGSKLQLRRY